MPDPKSDALRYALLTGLGATGAGALQAYISDAMFSKKPLEELATRSPELVSIPHPVKKKKRKPEKNTQSLIEEMPLLQDKTAGDKSFLSGDYAKSVLDVPWFYPLAAGLGFGGLYAGHGLIADRLKEQRKKKMLAEEEKARDEFEQSLLSSYDPEKIKLQKSAKLKEINEDLEKLASILKIAESKPSLSSVLGDPVTSTGPGIVEKALAVPAHVINAATGNVAKETFAPWLSQGTGLALLAGLGIPAATAAMAYKYWKDRDKTKLMNEAAESRQLARLQENMAEPYVTIE